MSRDESYRSSGVVFWDQLPALEKIEIVECALHPPKPRYEDPAFIDGLSFNEYRFYLQDTRRIGKKISKSKLDSVVLKIKAKLSSLKNIIERRKALAQPRSCNEKINLRQY